MQPTRKLKPLNWVKARSECSVERVFLRLAELIESNVHTARSLARSTIKFDVNRPTLDTVIVVRKINVGGGLRRVDAVTFERTDRGIVVSSANADGTTPSFIATPDFADDGECRMRINDEEQLLELWQVSRRALETLFFS